METVTFTSHQHYNSVKQSFAAAVRRLMDARALTPAQVQAKSTQQYYAKEITGDPISSACVYSYTSGKSLPTRGKLNSLAAALEVKTTDLLPDGVATVHSRGRRRVEGEKQHVEVRRAYGGLKNARLIVDAVMPAATAGAIADLVKRKLNLVGGS